MNVHKNDSAGDSPAEEPKTGHDVESPQAGETGEFNLAGSSDQLQRGLKSRHIQFLALGASSHVRAVAVGISNRNI